VARHGHRWSSDHIWYICDTWLLHHVSSERSKPQDWVVNVQNKPKIIKNRWYGAKWCLVARATRQERTVRVPCVAHAPFWPILSISDDIRLVLHVDNSFLRFGTLDTPSSIESVSVDRWSISEAAIIYGIYVVYIIVVTVRLHYGRKPQERVANGQNKPKIINNRLDGAKWCLVAHGTC